MSAQTANGETTRKPALQPLGDSALLVRFSDTFDLAANTRAIALARQLHSLHIGGVVEICPNLTSVLVRYQPSSVSYFRLVQELDLLLCDEDARPSPDPVLHEIEVRYGGADGPHLEDVAAALDLSGAEFIEKHGQHTLRVMAIGFAPGFAYCGMHEPRLTVPRREHLTPSVPPGTVLFAAGQTAITATDVPTGWHVIGHTSFRNFDVSRDPPTILHPGDMVQFKPVRDRT